MFQVMLFRISKLIFSFVVLLTLLSCSNEVIENGRLFIEINDKLETVVNNQECSTPLTTSFRNTEYLLASDGPIDGFMMENSGQEAIEEAGMKGTRYFFEGSNNDGIKKTLNITVWEAYPDLATYKVKYTNEGEQVFDLQAWVNHDYEIKAGNEPGFWSFQGSSSSERADWIRPVNDYVNNENYMGMNNSDYGGGIPVLDLWRRDGGVAIGHVEPVARLISFPIHKNRYEEQVQMAAKFNYQWPQTFNPGDELETFETFVSVHDGDCFATLRNFSNLMQDRGMEFPESEPSAFESMWCAWGYERNFTIDEVIGTLPKVKELGIKWATLDDGFQVTEGDWYTNDERFPNGDADMLRITKAIHDYGLKAQIWWAPLAVSPDSRLLKEHPNILLKTDEWAPQYITWWDAWYMAPTDSAALAHTKEVVEMFIDRWDFDGIKLDGQHLNAVEPDHGQRAGLEYPEQAVEKLPDFFHLIYETAREIKPHALLQHCPCGTCMSFYNMPTTNQVVSSDPLNSKQIRQKGKVYKAIMPQTAYFGDHVELSDNGDDFASSFGIGAVLGTKFTWPKDNPTVSPGYLLTPEKEKVWRKWFSLYDEKMLSREEYLGGLYDIGFDVPETHVIRKGETLYYAFYQDEWNGALEFRGLDPAKSYMVVDYVNDAKLGTISGDNPVLDASFKQYLLVQLEVQ
jgi:alpha-galactosidase